MTGPYLLVAKVIGVAVVLSLAAAGIALAKQRYDASVRAPIEAQRDKARADLKTCQDSTATLEHSIGRQNKSIEALEAAAKTLKEESDRKVAEAEKKAGDKYAAAQRQLQRPRLDPDVCISAAKRAREFAAGRRP